MIPSTALGLNLFLVSVTLGKSLLFSGSLYQSVKGNDTRQFERLSVSNDKAEDNLESLFV